MPRTPIAFALAALLSVVVGLTAPVEGAGAKPKPRPPHGPSPIPTASSAPTPTSGWLEGIDVSHHQGSIDWTRVAGSGVRFVFARASAGTLTEDGTYGANRVGARNAGLAVGAYHFANPDAATNDALNEANWFIQLASPASGDLRPVLDIEVSNGLSQSALTSWVQIWLARVFEARGVRPIIYTSPNFWRTYLGDTTWFAANGYTILWTAHWTTASSPSVPASNWGGQGWTFWQYSSSGTVPGIAGPADLDRYNGTALPASLFIP